MIESSLEQPSGFDLQYNINMLSYSVVFIKKINLSSLCHWCFPVKFTNLLKQQKQSTEVFCKKVFFQVLQYSQKTKGLQNRFFPVNIAKILRIPIFKNICKRLPLKQLFYRTLVSNCICIGSSIKFIDRLWTIKLLSIQCYIKSSIKTCQFIFSKQKNRFML